MENFSDTQWQERGCFVYQITSDGGLGARSSLNVGDDNRTGAVFAKDDLVSVDLVRPSRSPGSTNGPFLRLSDNSGWLFEKKYGEVMMKRLPVESGLWAFYVDNVPTGAELQAHPFTQTPMPADHRTTYRPMQLLYCDRRVLSPSTQIASYRVQGTDSWVLESNEDKSVFFFIPEHNVQVGLFAYEVQEGSSNISVYSKPSVSGRTELPISFGEGEILICDMIRQSPFNTGNGPFLRLVDGWGWMYEQMSNDPSRRMHQLPIEQGIWTLKVMNAPVGIAMRRHPLDRGDVNTSTVFMPGDIVKCDRKIKSSGPTSFYRVAGSDGWVFDLRDAYIMMELISSQPLVTDQLPQPVIRGWTVEFIRGLASAFELKEIMHNETSRVISFKTDADERINIYYTTRTVGTALDHPSQGKTQLFRKYCSEEQLKDIMQNPRVHTGRGYHRKRARCDEIDVRMYGRRGEEHTEDTEDYYRNKVVEYEKEEATIADKKMKALKILKSIDDERAKDAAKMDSQIEARTEEFRKIQREKEAAEWQRQKEMEAAELRRIRQAEELIRRAEELRRRTCSVCEQSFVDAHAMNQHYNSVHVFTCGYCDREFNSRRALDQHKEALYH
ncbi:hypothetical protein ACHAWF_018294 [Thalassiosira exigua]